MSEQPDRTVNLWIQRRYASRYTLLGAMADELAQACADRGLAVHDGAPDGAHNGSGPGAFVFFNMIPSIDALPAAVRRPGSNIAAVQILVDHPLALDPAAMDATSRLPNFRLLLPSIDGLHLLRLRWPQLRHSHMPHGVARSALAPAESVTPAALAEREFDVVLAGSIHSDAELAALRETVPEPARPWAQEIVALMVAEPQMPFEQAVDLVAGSRGLITGNWSTLAGLWRVTSAHLNRLRRVAMLESLDGLDVAVFGGEAWREHCTGSARWMGEAEYTSVPVALARGRVCLAWGPTQFPHTFSERLLLSMAAGCASVAEDRYLIGRHFEFDGPGQTVEVFDPRDPGAGRAAIEGLLREPDRLASVARRGREAAEDRHLWEHRVESVVGAAADALGIAGEIRRTA